MENEKLKWKNRFHVDSSVCVGEWMGISEAILYSNQLKFKRKSSLQYKPHSIEPTALCRVLSRLSVTLCCAFSNNEATTVSRTEKKLKVMVGHPSNPWNLIRMEYLSAKSFTKRVRMRVFQQKKCHAIRLL